MKTNYSIHPNYKKHQTFLLKMLTQFEEHGSVLVNGQRNVIKKFEDGDEVFTVKRFKNPNFIQRWVYQFLRKSKAKRSYEYANILKDKAIKTPAPVMYLENFSGGLKESYYVSAYIEYDFDFRTLIHNPKWPNRKEILEQFTRYTFLLHEHNIRFLDHSPGNTLVVTTNNITYDFYLIDLNRMRFQELNLQQRMKNFRRLWLSKGMIQQMAPVYAKLYGSTVEETQRWMLHYSRKFQKKVNSKKLRRRKLK